MAWNSNTPTALSPTTTPSKWSSGANNLFKQLTVRSGYTWSKTLDNTSEIFGTGTAGNTTAFAQNPTQTGSAEYSISGLNVPNAWTISFVEQVPFFTNASTIPRQGASADGLFPLTTFWPQVSPIPWYKTTEEAIATAAGDFYDANFVGNFVGPDIARPF